MTNETIREVVGFDFGHGETAAALMNLEGLAHPEMLEISGKRNWVTAIARHPSRGLLVGAEALGMPEVAELDLAFKGIPGDDTARRRLLREYIRTCHQRFLDSHQVRGEGATAYLVGCPSGWRENERRAYEELLRESGIERLKVVSESRAAFMHAKESGKFTGDELFRAILVIDVGSSTTDYTAVSGLAQVPADFGHNALGAGLIDDLIFEQVIATHPERAKLQSAFANSRTHSARCRYCCRLTKEAFFSNEEMYRETGMPAKGYEDVGLELDFPVRLDAALVDELMRRPITALGGLSFPDAFRKSLEDAREQLARTGVEPEFILMTGGASRMRFLHGLVSETFPSATVRHDSEPQFMVARGLARVARWDLLVERFMRDVDALAASGRIRDLLRENLPQLVDLLAKPLTEGLFRNAIQPALREWQTHQLRTLTRLETRIPELADEWLRSEEGALRVADVTRRWLEGVRDQIERETLPLTRKYFLPGGGLKIDVRLDATRLKDIVYVPKDPGQFDFLTAVAGLLVSVVLANLAGGAGIALIHAGPAGWLVGLLLGAGATLGGMKFMRNRLKALNIPAGRGLLLPDSRIEAIYQQNRDEFETRLRAWMRTGKDSRQTFDQFIDDVHNKVHNALVDAARKVLIDIR